MHAHIYVIGHVYRVYILQYIDTYCKYIDWMFKHRGSNSHHDTYMSIDWMFKHGV